MIATLIVLAYVCALSLFFILVIPPLASTKLFMRFLPADIREAANALRHGAGFWRIFGRYMLFMYGYKIFDILVQDRYIVIKRKYYLRFFPETAGCKSWDDPDFNKSNQMKRLIVFPFVCALSAWITVWIGR